MTTPDSIQREHEPAASRLARQSARRPQRTCVGCRTTLPQTSLVRCATGPHGPVVSRTAAGRGAWLCSLECFDLAAKRRGFERAWKQSVDADALATLRIAFAGVITNMTEMLVVGSRPDRPALMKG